MSIIAFKNTFFVNKSVLSIQDKSLHNINNGYCCKNCRKLIKNIKDV